MSSEILVCGMPLNEWNKLAAIFRELDIDADPYMACEHYGKIRCDLSLVRLGMMKKQDFPSPEKYKIKK